MNGFRTGFFGVVSISSCGSGPVRRHISLPSKRTMRSDMTAILPQKLLLTRDDLPRLGINISPSTLLRLEAAGKFPRRVRLGHHSVAWLASEIEAHIEQLAADRTSDR